MDVYLDSIKNYIGFNQDDTEALQALLSIAEPHLQRFTDHFYERIHADEDASQVLQNAEQGERLKDSFLAWLRSGLSGPHDLSYYQRRARIGQMHVVIGLPQRFMFTAMNVVRRDLQHLADEHFVGRDQERKRTHDAINRLLDMELAIMLQTYQEDSDARLTRHERLATIGQIAAGIGHDLRNPLGVMQSSLYLVRKRIEDDPRAQRHLDKIEDQIRTCDEIINNLLELTRSTPTRRLPVDIKSIFQKALDAAACPPHIFYHVSVADNIDCWGDAGLLKQALINVITNAVQAYPKPGGRLWLSARTEPQGTVIEVTDDGPGFDREALQSVFEPLVTTRSSGTGLGLALVKGITERHGGTVTAQNRPEGGAVVRMTIPHLNRETDGY